MNNDEDTEELQAKQLEREAAEKALEESTTDEHEAAQHARRAEKARYLRSKLEDRAESERDSDS